MEGDFVKLIEKDFKLINQPFDIEFVRSMTKNQFRKWVKSNIEKSAFDYVMKEKESKSKIKDITYKKLKIQKSKIISNHQNFQTMK